MSTTLTANVTTTIMKQQQCESCRITEKTSDILGDFGTLVLLLETSVLCESD